jgi:hypothetical protein
MYGLVLLNDFYSNIIDTLRVQQYSAPLAQLEMAVPEDFKYPILLEEWPYVYAIHNKYSSSHCHYCLKGFVSIVKYFATMCSLPRTPTSLL